MPEETKEKKDVENRTPQHIYDEALADETRQRMKELEQIEMFDDPYLNWSGHR
jgi:hypothetical protein|tara:strand:+ start:578 stop:736 length:159 start_codon:yes stop_codon:yes gene_type:complete